MSVTLPIILTLAALAFVFPVSAEALGANVVPNAGFEQAGCGGSSSVCDWSAAPSSPPEYANSVSLDAVNVHSGSASMLLSGSESSNITRTPTAWASTDAAFCAAIGPGVHPASFWYAVGADVDIVEVEMDAAFYQGPDCTGAASGSSLTGWAYGSGWDQVTGVLIAPPGTGSALFSLGVLGAGCGNGDGCAYGANFDDLVVDAAAISSPAITSFTPTRGPDGTSIDIRGANFTGASSVTVGGVAASFTVDSDTEIHAILPNGAATGRISVTSANGTGTSDHEFEVAPTISSISPTCGAPGTSVEIRGSGLDAAWSVEFGGVDTTFTVVSDAEIRAIVPGWATPGPISVLTPVAPASSSPFTGPCDAPAPTIDSLSPSSGAPRTSVDIRGANFTWASTVNFIGSAAGFRVDSDTEITATVPKGAVTGPISVTTASGTGTSSSSYAVIAAPDTTITSGPPPTTTASSATFQFTATEPSIFECSLDTAPFAACSSPASYTGLGAGSHTFRVRATDTAGNTDPTPAQQTWTVVPNTPPTARFTFRCSDLRCHFAGTGSSDADGTIANYAWDFGDGTSISGSSADHTYAYAASYAVTLTVTDNAGATGRATSTVTPIALTARGYRVNTLERVDLSWNGTAGAGFDVYRNGAKIAPVQTTAYTDDLKKKASGTYTQGVRARVRELL
jgi:hypothetical protein